MDVYEVPCVMVMIGRILGRRVVPSYGVLRTEILETKRLWEWCMGLLVLAF